MYDASKVQQEILSQRMKYDQWLAGKYGELIEEIVGKDASEMTKFTYKLWALRFEQAGFHPTEIYQCLKELHDKQLRSPRGAGLV